MWICWPIGHKHKYTTEESQLEALRELLGHGIEFGHLEILKVTKLSVWCLRCGGN